MICRHIPMRSGRRSSFRELVAYITHAKDKAVRIGEVRVTNCHQQEAQDAVLEVLATQLQNQRDDLNIEYGRLELEQATYAEPRRIDDEARQKLGMVDPRPQDIRLLR